MSAPLPTVNLTEDQMAMVVYALKEMGNRRQEQAIDEDRPSLCHEAERHYELANLASHFIFAVTPRGRPTAAGPEKSNTNGPSSSLGLKTELRLCPHQTLPGEQVIEMIYNGFLIATVSGAEGCGIQLVGFGIQGECPTVARTDGNIGRMELAWPVPA